MTSDQPDHMPPVVEGDDDDAYDAKDHEVSWDRIGELADRAATVGDDRASARRFYDELAGHTPTGGA